VGSEEAFERGKEVKALATSIYIDEPSLFSVRYADLRYASQRIEAGRLRTMTFYISNKLRYSEKAIC
jgi:hypothetical protein